MHSIPEDIWIPVSGGIRLSAKIWLPQPCDADNPVPAVLEYSPYRKGDLTAASDQHMHGHFADQGFASVRVDVRGTGDSDGHLDDEYLPSELDDACEVLAWIAAQPWCTGRVGMVGISWGGFSALQVAARQPPELAAVISVASSDDRYGLDVHYLGGSLHAWDQVTWGSTLTALSALPPVPGSRPDWRDVWLDRLERTGPVVDTWLSHQRRDEYWKHGSVREDYAKIDCPLFMVGGWADPYHDAVLRLAAALPHRVRAMIGPWAHCYPHVGTPGPSIGFLTEAVRWWRHWLKGETTGLEHEPACRFWIQAHLPADASYDERRGSWVSEDSWPPALVSKRLFLAAGTLESAPAPASLEGLSHRSALIPPSDRGNWCPAGWAPCESDIPGDQRPENDQDLTFVSPPLDESITVLGRPTLRLVVSVDRPVAALVVRLCDVGPDGSATLISRGFLNLTRRKGDEEPEPVVPGERLDVSIELGAIGYELARGHRTSVSVGTSYWPWIWPSPQVAEARIHPGEGTYLELPCREGASGVRDPEFGPPEPAGDLVSETVGAPEPGGRTHLRPEPGQSVIHDRLPAVCERMRATGHVFGADGHSRFSIAEGDPLSARIDCERRFFFGEGESRLEVRSASTLTSSRTHFHLSTRLEAYEGGVSVHSRSWAHEVARDLM